MKKIFINKNDDPAKVVEKILAEGDHDLVLVIPKFSQLADSVANFHLLKREATTDSKNIVVESVDDNALALAQAAKIPGLNPFLSARRQSLADIIPPSGKNKNIDADEVVASEDASVSGEDKIPSESSAVFYEPRSWRLPRLSRRFSVVVGIIAVAIFALFLSSPSVEIALALKSYDWSNNGVITAAADKNLDVTSGIIGAEVFTKEQNITLQFPASGSREIKNKATGIATIYNAFSSQAQPLVVRTRLLTPEGKLFRLTKDVVVPGASVIDGDIIPSSIDVEVVADQAGEEFNIGPVSRFSIPGFQGSSKYDGFYADSKGSMSGGYVGEEKYATETDIDNAESEIKQTLSEALLGLVSTSLPEGFAVLPEATRVTITETKVDESAGSDGLFSIYAAGRIELISFRTDDLDQLLASRAGDEIGFPVTFRTAPDLDPADLTIDWDNYSVSFKPQIKVSVTKSIDEANFKESIQGKNSAEVKDYIMALTGVENARVSFWPLWADTIPSGDKVKLTIE